jgi:hypothetical protein
MYAAGVCAKGVTDMYFVPPTTKVNHWFFINSILKLIVEKDIPRLYPGEGHKVVLHFDSAGEPHDDEGLQLARRTECQVYSERGMAKQLSRFKFHGFWPKWDFETNFVWEESNGIGWIEVGCASSLCGFPCRNLREHCEVLAWPCEKDDRESGLPNRKLKIIIFCFLGFERIVAKHRANFAVPLSVYCNRSPQHK